MFDRTPVRGSAQVAGGARVGQNFDPNAQNAQTRQQVFGCGVDPQSCNPNVIRTMVGFDTTPRATPYVDTAVVNTIANTAAAATAWGVTISPKCPMRVLAIYFGSATVAHSSALVLRAAYVGANGQRAQDNLLAQLRESAELPLDVFADLNACVPLFDMNVCISQDCPLILTGVTTAISGSLITVRGGLIVEKC